jgi:hypothetical protein
VAEHADRAPSPYIDYLVERCVTDVIAGRAQIDDYLRAFPALADQLSRRIEHRLVRELAERVQGRLAEGTDDARGRTRGPGQ